MAAHAMNTSRVSLAMERTGQWILSQDIPTDILVQVGEVKFPLHKLVLVAKSNYIRRLMKEPDLTKLDLSSIPGGAEIFERAAKFCYGVNFEITIHNVAALRCAAEYLDMTDPDDNLAGRTDEFLVQVALATLSGAIVVLKSCEQLLPIAEQIDIVQRCVDVASAKACNEANFPSRSPANWWTDELSIVHIYLFEKIITSMKSRGAKAIAIASAIITYTEKSFPNLVRDHYGNSITSSISIDSVSRNQQRQLLLDSIVSLLPAAVENQRASFPINFLSRLLREAIFLGNDHVCKKRLEKRISAMLEHVTVDDLLVLSCSFDGDELFDLESVERIISRFVEKEKNVSVFDGGDFTETSSAAMLRVAKTVDAYLGEIATIPGLSISKLNGIANLVPKTARKFDDDLYRAMDIYLKAHSNLDEIEREKVCSSMDPLKLSYEARVHASQNKRLPVQIVLHALYFDQLQIRSDKTTPDMINMRSQVQADVSLTKENESLRSELSQMKAYISDMQNKSQVGSTSAKLRDMKKPTFFSSMSKKLGKFNPFKNGSKDTSNIEDDDYIDRTKPRRRRFSIS